MTQSISPVHHRTKAKDEEDSQARAFLIVNADDYGYFASVSQGIIACAMHGTVTATGIMANGAHFAERIQWLQSAERLDLGVHLNLTFGEPLTKAMARLCSRWSGRFPGKAAVVFGILRRHIPVTVVLAEWRAQVRRCLEAGLDLCFLNSHEHLHMLPPLFGGTLSLAQEFAIPHVRYARAEWFMTSSVGAILRNTALEAVHVVNRRIAPRDVPVLLGMSKSGKLSLSYVRTVFASLEKGKVFELMCHPGYFDSREIVDKKLLDYHDWNSEVKLLQGSEFRKICDTHGVEVIGYRDLRNWDQTRGAMPTTT